MAEERTKGIVTSVLKDLPGNAANQDVVSTNGITWFKEDSYKNSSYNWIGDMLKTASKKQTGNGSGTPDFTEVKSGSDTIIIIECKDKLSYHSSLVNLTDHIKKDFGSKEATQGYAVDGALWYASYLKDKCNVIAVAISGARKSNIRATIFSWPKKKSKTDIALVSDGGLSSILPFDEYEKIFRKTQSKDEAAVRKELKSYTLACAEFLRNNGIEDNSKAGFISAIFLGLTNKESAIYRNTKKAIDDKKAAKSKTLIDDIGKSAVSQLQISLYGEKDAYGNVLTKGIWDIDNIPAGKRSSLQKFYDTIFAKDILTNAPKGKDNKYFKDGDTFLSCCIYSVYENVTSVLDQYPGIDIMGEFYTTFLRFTKGNAKEKGIVLTPKHITDLFCNIAEYYSGEKFSENTKVLDICCGTGAFLIAALSRIKDNINAGTDSDAVKRERYIKAQEGSLIGVEKDNSMYALAYANMRFHGDGKSNLFNCSSLLMDSFAPLDDCGVAGEKGHLSDELKSFEDIDIGMINPPYSLDKKSKGNERDYGFENDKASIEDRLKKINHDIENSVAGNGDKYEDLKAERDKLESDLRNITENAKEIGLQDGQSELDFIASMLYYLKKGGIGIAIVPMSCAGSSNKAVKKRREILECHTLLACITMPDNLFFDSHVGVKPCIMVFKAHIPHEESGTATFMARWLDDGFTVIPHNGRKETPAWEKIRKEWMAQMRGETSDGMGKTWICKKIGISDEALAEAYIETDYSALCDADFEKVLKRYALFKYAEDKGLIEV